MNKNLSFVFLLLFLCSSLNAQFSFYDKVDILEVQNFHSGVAIVVADMNGDTFDDIVRLQNGVDLWVEYQNADGSYQAALVEEDVGDGSQWTMAVADVNNDGRCEIMTGDYSIQKIWMTEDVEGFKNVYGTGTLLPDGGFFSQGSNFADINNDGWLDAFHCNDNGESGIWLNDGTGNLLRDQVIDMSIDGSSGEPASGNYGSVWSDIDHDGDLDLYIAKCRQGVDDPEDPRRINTLWINDGENNFTESAVEHGLASGWQSWTSELQDIDNDGDFDVFLTNHDHAAELFINDGNGFFTDITETSGIDLGITPIQAAFKDFDNDGWVDLLVTGSDFEFYRNNRDNTFTQVPGLFDGRNMESFAVGDVNHDGYLDVYGGYASIYTTPTNTDDALWINSASGFNFLAVNLIGVESNRNAIGAKVEIFGEFGQQIRELRSGESYGINHSATAHFGLGEFETVASLVISWPSGAVDTYENLEANQFITVIENTCISPTATVTASGPTTFCSGNSVSLTAPEGFEYEWSNGEVSQEIEILEAGSYSVQIIDDSGCWANSASIQVTVDPDETPSIEALGDTKICLGDVVSIAAPEGLTGYNWSNGETGNSIEVGESGTYSVTVTGECADFTSSEIEVEVFDAEEPILFEDVIQSAPGVSVVLEAEGELISWYDAAEGGTLLGEGPTYETPILDVNTTFYAENISSNGQEDQVGGKLDFGEGGPNGQQFNGSNIFNAWEPFVLNKIDVQAFSAGERTFQIRDAANNVLAESTAMVEEGISTIEVNLEVPAGENMVLRCAQHPNLFRNENDVSYPYAIGTVGEVTGSPYGDEWYYYFYNWQITKLGVPCNSARVPVTVNVFGVGIEDLNNATLNIYPNPAEDVLNVEWNGNLEGNLVVVLSTMDGKIVTQKQTISAEDSNTLQLDLNQVPSGAYMLEISDGGQTVHRKVIKR